MYNEYGVFKKLNDSRIRAKTFEQSNTFGFFKNNYNLIVFVQGSEFDIYCNCNRPDVSSKKIIFLTTRDEVTYDVFGVIDMPQELAKKHYLGAFQYYNL